jgi:hypothetical protein
LHTIQCPSLLRVLVAGAVTTMTRTSTRRRRNPILFRSTICCLGRPPEIAAPPRRRELISRGRSPLRGGADHVCVARQGGSSPHVAVQHDPPRWLLRSTGLPSHTYPLEPCARARRLTLLVATTGRGRNASLPVGLPPCRRGRPERRGKTKNDFLEQMGRWFR